MELKATAYSEGTVSARFACVLSASLLSFRCAYKCGLCSIALGLVTAWSCISDNISVSDEKFLWKAKVYICAIKSNVHVRGRKAYTKYKHCKRLNTSPPIPSAAVRIHVNLLPASSSQPDYIPVPLSARTLGCAMGYAQPSTARTTQAAPKFQAAPQIPGRAGGKGQSLQSLGRGRAYPRFSATLRTG